MAKAQRKAQAVLRRREALAQAQDPRGDRNKPGSGYKAPGSLNKKQCSPQGKKRR